MGLKINPKSMSLQPSEITDKGDKSIQHLI